MQNIHVSTGWSDGWLAASDTLGSTWVQALAMPITSCVTSQNICSASRRDNNSAKPGGWLRIR